MRAGVQIAVALLAFAAGSSAQTPQQSEWIGSIDAESKRSVMHLWLSRTSCEAAFPLSGEQHLPVTAVAMNGRSVSLEVRRGTGPLRFNGTVEANTIRGQVQGGLSGTFELARTASLASHELERYLGLYELGPNWLVAITLDEFGPIYLDFASGEIRTIFHRDGTTFFAGSRLFDPVPLETELQFTVAPGGSVAGVEWRDRGRPIVTGKRINFRREEVAFSNGDIRLSGTLVLPNTRGPHPALVRVHGAGPATRFCQTAEWWAYHGVAFLSYDKRGVGKSTGEWREASMPELASDAVAGVEMLARRKDIDGRKIGIVGGSEGGWVAPEAARQSEKVAFLIGVPASGLSLADHIVEEIRLRMQAGGFSAKEIELATVLRRRLNTAIIHGTGWDELRAAIGSAKKERWFSLARVDWAERPLDAAYVKRQREYIGYDPTTAWSRLRCPALIMIGTLDDRIPVESLSRIQEAARQNGNSSVEFAIFPNGSHVLTEATRRSLNEYPEYRRYVPGVFQTMLNWTLRKVGIGERR